MSLENITVTYRGTKTSHRREAIPAIDLLLAGRPRVSTTVVNGETRIKLLHQSYDDTPYTVPLGAWVYDYNPVTGIAGWDRAVTIADDYVAAEEADTLRFNRALARSYTANALAAMAEMEATPLTRRELSKTKDVLQMASNALRTQVDVMDPQVNIARMAEALAGAGIPMEQFKESLKMLSDPVLLTNITALAVQMRKADDGEEEEE